MALSVAFHDSIKNRWINNKLNWKHLVDIHALASSPLHRNLPIPCSHKLFMRLGIQVCVAGNLTDDGEFQYTYSKSQ